MSPAKMPPILAFWFPITTVLSRSLAWSPAWGPSAAPCLTGPPLPLPAPPLPSLPFSPCCPSPASPAPSPFPSTSLLVVSPLTKRRFFWCNIFCPPCPGSFPLMLQSHWLAFPKLAAHLHLAPATTFILLGILLPPVPGGLLPRREGRGLHQGKARAPSQIGCFWGAVASLKAGGAFTFSSCCCCTRGYGLNTLQIKNWCSGYDGACIRCSEGFLLNLKSITSHNNLSKPEHRRMLTQCG